MKPSPVDFGYARAPAVKVASIAWSGPWNERRIQTEFEKVAAWAKRNGVRTGRWIFREPGTRRWEASIEVRGSARGSGPVKVKTLRACAVARIEFDPNAVSPRVIYHGMSDWLRWQKREKKIRAVLSTREVYGGNPWRDAAVWARTEVQFLVRK
ncbi:MAG: GyrI-like domain-containing protein [Thermoplasmata archaeon]